MLIDVKLKINKKKRYTKKIEAFFFLELKKIKIKRKSRFTAKSVLAQKQKNGKHANDCKQREAVMLCGSCFV